ncbi:MAG: AIM24 family protein, partial [Oscillospiraceae bacterium]|nr:AIM24 family protein [Oscillospiraceae bacterium]
IEGGSLPALVIQLEPGEGLVSESGGRTWIRGPITSNVKADGGLGGSIGRMFSGESLFLNHYKANGAGEIAFTSSFPGRIISRQLAPGESVICQKRAFLCATEGTKLEIFFRKKVGAGLFGGEGFIMQKVTGPGLAFFEIDGYSKEYNLAAGEQLVCDTGVVAMMDPTCEMDVRMVGSVKNALFGGEGLVDTVITGPGKVMLQTMPIYKVAGAIQPYIVQSK